MLGDSYQHAAEECFSEKSSVELEAELVQIALKILRLYVVKDILHCGLLYMARMYLANLFFSFHLQVIFSENFVRVGVG